MLASHPIPRVLARRHLLIGCEREPILVAALLCGGVAVATMSLIGFVVCGAIWIGSLTALRWVAKADPQMTRVYHRSLKYAGYYPAHSRPYRHVASAYQVYYAFAGFWIVVIIILYWVL